MNRSSDSYMAFIGPLRPEVYEVVADKYNLSVSDESVREITPYYVSGDDERYIASALLKAREKIIEQRSDKKTGALVDWAFREEVNRAIGLHESVSSYNGQSGLVLVTIDAEEFKQVNELYGHPAGDKVLRGIVDFAKSIARINDGDIVGRIGGDEFAILLNFDKSVISETDFIKLLDERMIDCPLEQIPNLAGVRWNHAFFEPGMTTEELFEQSDVKGEDIKKYVRAHSMTETENEWALELALSKSLPLLQ